MFVVYTRDSTNVTLSTRLGTGHVMPQHDSSTQATLLDGSGVSSDGSFVANIRCDNCNSWSGGSMSFTDSSSSWIYAARTGDALDTEDVSASIAQHSSDTSFQLDLTTGTGGNSANPFVSQSEGSSSSASPSGTGTATSSPTGSGTTSTATNGVSNPIASDSSSSNSGSASSSVQDNTATLMNAHGLIMTVLFLACFPLFSLTLYLPFAQKVRYVHAPLQILSMILLIVGMSLGIVLGNRMGELDGYHMVIGFIVVASLVLFQPAMGIYQHLYYHKTGGRSMFGVAHRWLGRSMIILGIVNGGLGWHMSGTASAYVPYAVVAVIVFLIYISVLIFAWYKSGKPRDAENEKTRSDQGYEMSPHREPKHQRLPSNPVNHHNVSMYQQQQQQHNTRTNYTIGNYR